MEVNGPLDFENEKSASIHHKSNPNGSRELINAFWTEAISFHLSQ